MSLKYLARIESDEDYYINNNYNSHSLRTLLEDIQKAKTTLAEYEARLMLRYSESTRTTPYWRIIATREQASYGDKKVYIRVKAETFKKLDGVEVDNSLIYNSCKNFKYKNMTEALLYIYELLGQYPGSKYYNNTPYGRMEI